MKKRQVVRRIPASHLHRQPEPEDLAERTIAMMEIGEVG